jgi:hypothetical protein
MAPKFGENVAWHPACFQCTTCAELLVDLTYCVHEEQLYCERHYAEQLKPRCSACDEVSFFLPLPTARWSPTLHFVETPKGKEFWHQSRARTFLSRHRFLTPTFAFRLLLDLGPSAVIWAPEAFLS